MAGATDWPEQTDSRTQLQDGIDVIQADDVNDCYVTDEAIEDSIGGNGKGASWATDLMTYLANTGSPKCTKASASSISISAGSLVIKNSGQSNRLMRRNTSTVTLTASDLDTGAMAVGFYYIYAVADSAATTFTGKFSASATAPTGLTNFELIGWFYNETSSVLDVTSGFVSNVKAAGRNVENMLVIEDTTDTSITGDTTYHNGSPASIKFYAPSRRIEARMTAQFYAGGASQYGTFTWSVDGSDNASAAATATAGASAALTTGLPYVLPVTYAGAIAADTCTLIPRVKAGDGSYTIHMYKKFIVIREI